MPSLLWAAMRSEAVGVMIARGDLAVEVMLNMGPHIQQAVTVLDSILRRMQAHQSKKTSMLRQLHSWDQPPWP